MATRPCVSLSTTMPPTSRHHRSGLGGQVNRGQGALAGDVDTAFPQRPVVGGIPDEHRVKALLAHVARALGTLGRGSRRRREIYGRIGIHIRRCQICPEDDLFMEVFLRLAPLKNKADSPPARIH